MENKHTTDYDGMGDFSRFPNQGKTKKQYQDSAKIMTLASFGLGMVIISMIIFGIITNV
jgi:hypothetical protein